MTTNEASSPREPWGSVEEVAEQLGVAKDTVYRWIESRGLPARRAGRLWKFKLAAVDEWVEARGADVAAAAAKKRWRR
jgi:excisionase family DNA binding protein